MWRTRPCSLSSASAAHPSSMSAAGIGLRAPAELPATAADRPRAEPDARGLQAGPAELPCLECSLAHRCSSHVEVVVSRAITPSRIPQHRITVNAKHAYGDRLWRWIPS